ncbi:hypothetical protein BDZ94DRAFT_1308345 [Collybia nuda]|uniref:Uncharacterized protein n=1 Tax=Collybia nuda TaxID=64659 RepID=A0A9P5Y7T3_9AGAR|nr:hypothetical protein BDZ94DRAFT_1308345 [Collybia nuda]
MTNAHMNIPAISAHEQSVERNPNISSSLALHHNSGSALEIYSATSNLAIPRGYGNISRLQGGTALTKQSKFSNNVRPPFIIPSHMFNTNLGSPTNITSVIDTKLQDGGPHHVAQRSPPIVKKFLPSATVIVCDIHNITSLYNSTGVPSSPSDVATLPKKCKIVDGDVEDKLFQRPLCQQR